MEVWDITESSVACYPDKGARVKYTDFYNLPSIHGNKIRNQDTGHIEQYDLFGNCEGKRILIVDDICDGGATFVLLADQLYANGAEEVNLFVTHGIFSKGLKPLRNAGIKRIFTNKGEAITMNDGDLGYRKI
jgi:phosphoribosylpyrophosphate synthetase